MDVAYGTSLEIANKCVEAYRLTSPHRTSPF